MALVSVMVATKFFCDLDSVLPSWVYVALLNDGSTPATLRALEMGFLAMVDFTLNVTSIEFEDYKKSVKDLIPSRQLETPKALESLDDCILSSREIIRPTD